MNSYYQNASEATRRGDELAEEAWIDVIRRMDQVYTELVQSQETLEAKHRELAASHQFTEGVLAAMTDVMVVCDTLGQVRQVNRAMIELTGLGENLLTACKLTDLVPGENERERLQQRLATGNAEGSDIEMALIARHGETIPVTWNVSALFDAQRRYTGFVAVGRPLGELKRAYAELQQTHEALKAAQAQLVQAEKMASLGRLVAGVAHELNNPISFIVGNSHAMQRYGGKLQQYLAAIHAEPQSAAQANLRQQLKIDRLLADLPSLTAGLLEGAERSGHIVDALKRFSAIESDQRQQVDLAECCKRALHWVSQAAPLRIETDCRGLDQPCLVTGSANQLQQVLVNLIQNAYDAVETVSHAHLQLTLDQQADMVRLTISDNGPGIDAANLARIFDPFFTTKPVGKGTGLGLSISYGIVEQHGGQLQAGNLPTGGACFTLTLPAGS